MKASNFRVHSHSFQYVQVHTDACRLRRDLSLSISSESIHCAASAMTACAPKLSQEGVPVHDHSFSSATNIMSSETTVTLPLYVDPCETQPIYNSLTSF